MIASADDRDVYVAGGYRLFAEALPLVDKMYITEVDMIVEDGDIFFPEFLMGKIGNAGKVYYMHDLKRPMSLAMNMFAMRFIETIGGRKAV